MIRKISFIAFLYICFLQNLHSSVLSEDVEELAFAQQRWSFLVDGPSEIYTLQARVYPPTKIQVNFWDSKKAPDNLMIFSTIDGTGTLEKALARYFARRDFWVVLPLIPEIENPIDEQTAKRMDAMYKRVQLSAQILQNKLKELNGLGRNFLMGASQGGIRSIMAAQTLEDVDAVWANVAGGNFPSLYAYSRVDELIEFRQNHMSFLGLKDPQRYQTFLSSKLEHDPLQSCGQIPARMSFVVALEDESVPTSNQLELLEACRPEKVKKIDSGHVRGVLDLILNKREIRKFFEQY